MLFVLETVCAGVLAVLDLQGAAFINASSTEMGCGVGGGGEMWSKWALGILRVLAIVPTWTPLNPRNLICKLGLVIPLQKVAERITWFIPYNERCTRTCIAAVSGTVEHCLPVPTAHSTVSLPSSWVTAPADLLSTEASWAGVKRPFGLGLGLRTLAQSAEYFLGVKNHV